MPEPEPVPVPVTGTLQIREYSPGDEQAILAAANRAFAAVDPTHTPRDLALWRWQFRDNPAGSRCVLALDPAGNVIAQYAGTGQRVRLDGQTVRFSQSVDSFAAPGSGLGRGAAFVRAGRAYAELYGGPERDVVMWGLPVPAAWRIGARDLGYEHLRTPLVLEAEPERLVKTPSDTVEVEELAQVPRDIDALFERVALDHGAIAVRDAAQLEWRFLCHPRRRYALAAARGPGLRGLAVYGRGALGGALGAATLGLVCDWLVPADDPDAARALWAWLGARARADSAGGSSGGPARLVALVPDSARAWLDFQRAGFRARPWRFVLAARCYAHVPSLDFLRRRWWYTLADTDLC